MKLPTYDRMMNPLLKALHDLGGSGTIDEINNKVIEILNLPDDIIEIPHSDTNSGSEIEYRLAWSRTYLKKYGLLENSSRGIWALTEINKNPIKIEPREIVNFVKEQNHKKNENIKIDNTSDELEIDNDSDIQNWKDELRSILLSIEPQQFERLSQRLLRESGFTQVEVTGKSGDGVACKILDVF